MINTYDELKELTLELEIQLLQLYKSPILHGESLQLSLGYKSLDAMRQSFAKGRAPIKLFKMSNRRGKYALTKDVAAYLAKTRLDIDKEEHMK
ncbi:hypothetical protein [Kangiella sp. TOML190]|uniref:hypothetical protein n=1 Tax=Kangiella sp. TOML190 TaxID=2931351 RepID=UPI00203BFD81|nr:hypothetical protein [Kangiella sp. TOML190]